MKNLFFACLLIVLSFDGAAFSQETSAEKLYEFKGVIKDKEAAVIAGTSLFFNGKDKSFEVKTDADGEFLTKLSPGKYEIKINKYISSDFIAFVEIRENALNPNNVEFILPINEVLNKTYPKIVRFAKPPYPPAARAVRATGEVVVTVKIDREGKVISAKAESGHPLLRTASEQAARSSLFEPSENIDEREAKLTFVYMNNGKQNLKHYSNPHRLEIISPPETFDY